MSKPNFNVAKIEVRKGENAGKLVGDVSIKMRFKFSIASNKAATNETKVM